MTDLSLGAAPQPTLPPVSILPQQTPEAPQANPYEVRPVSGTEISGVDNTAPEQRSQHGADADFTSPADIAKAALETNWSALAPSMSPDMLSHVDPDPTFSFKTLEPEQSKALFDGVPKELYGEYDGAVSFDHALLIRQRIDNYTAAHQVLTDAGWVGTVSSIAAGITDPETLALFAVGGPEVTAAAKWIAGSGRAAEFALSGSKGTAFALEGAKAAALTGVSRLPFLESDPYETSGDAFKMMGLGYFLGGAVGAWAHDPLSSQLTRLGKSALTGESTDPLMTGSLSAAVSEHINKYMTQSTDENIAQWARDRVDAKTNNKFGELLPAGTSGETAGQYDLAASILGAAHDGISAIGRLLTRNPSGRTFQEETAWETMSRIADTHIAEVETQKWASFRGWADGQGYNMAQRMLPETRALFEEQVDRATRTPGFGDDAHVAAAAKAQSDGYAKLLDLRKAAGIKGAENVEFNPNYVPRDYDLMAMQSKEARFGSPIFDRFLTNALKSGSDELTDEEADAIVQTAKRTILRGGYQMDQSVGQSIARSDIEKIRDAVVEEVKASGDTARAEDGDFIDSITRLIRNSEDRGKASNLKRRIGFDETYSQQMYPAAGGDAEPLSFMDLLHNNAARNFNYYARTVGGEVGLSRTLGVKSAGEMDTLVQKLKEADPKFYGADEASQKHRRAEYYNLDTMLRAIQGRSIDRNPEKLRWVKDALSVTRAYNTSRMLGMGGVSLFSAMGKTLWGAGFANAMRSMPVLSNIFRNAANGEWDNQFLNEMTALGAPGADRLLHSSEMAAHAKVGELNFGVGVKKLASGVTDLSGMTGIITMMERVAFSAAAQNFAQMATKGEGAGWSAERLAMLGLSEPRTRAIIEEMQNHSDFEDGIFGTKVATLNADRWHPANREAFAGALRRFTRQAVHKNDAGDLAPFMSTTLGQTLFQFRSFMTAAWAKNTLNAMHMRDKYAFNALMGELVFGGIAYGINTYMTAQGRPDADEYMKANLTPARLAAGAFARTGFSSIVPTVTDSILPALGVPEQFANVSTTGLHRGTGSSLGSFIDASPTGQLIHGAGQALTGLKNIATPGLHMDQAQFKATMRMLPGSTFMGVKGAINRMSQNFPVSDGTQP